MSTFAIPNENNTFEKQKSGAIAQLVEQRTENPCVPGSIPGGTTKNLNRSTSIEVFCVMYPKAICGNDRCERTLSLLVRRIRNR